MNIIISDTTALIILAKTNHFYLLTNIINKVYVLEAVIQEVNYKNDNVKLLVNSLDFLEIKKVTNKNILKFYKLLKIYFSI